MASRRYRSKLSLNSNIADINAKVSEISKRPLITGAGENSITNVAITDETIIASNLAPNSVTNEKLAPESVSKSKITADVFTEPIFTGFIQAPALYLEVPNSEEGVLGGQLASFPTGRIYGLYYPVGLDASILSITGTGTSSITTAVTFFPDAFLPAGSALAPIVTVTSGNSNFLASVSSVTSTGMNITLRRIDNATFTTTVSVSYIAIQF